MFFYFFLDELKIKEDRFAGRIKYAHRVAFRLFKKESIFGKFVLHKCDNPSCVNPDHLFTGNQKENQQDSVNKMRHISGALSKNMLKKHQYWLAAI